MTSLRPLRRLAPLASLRDALVALAGADVWAERMAELAGWQAAGPRQAAAIRRRHAIELAIDQLCHAGAVPTVPAVRRVAALAGAIVALADELPPAGQCRLAAALRDGLAGTATLAPLCHLLHSAEQQRQRGFRVRLAGLHDDAPFDLLLTRGGAVAEQVCDVVSAEAGREVERAAWLVLGDQIEPDLRHWLTGHRGVHLLRLTLPVGLHPAGIATAAQLRSRIVALLRRGGRHDSDAAAVMRLDSSPACAVAPSEARVMANLREEFGPEAHLAVTVSSDGVFAMAARAGQPDAIGAAMRCRLAGLAPRHLTGTRPGILAILLDDTSPAVWRCLSDELELEAETRKFFTTQAARHVVAVSCTARSALLCPNETSNELRFRNPGHPAAGMPALAPAVLSSV